jgi:DNA replication and repair protein RecF
MTGSMTDRLYLDDLKSYRRVLTQRNALFKTGGSRSSRQVWDQELVGRGCALIERRIALVDTLARHLENHIDELDLGYAVEVRYESDLVDNIPEGVTREEHFTARLVDLEIEESRRKTTLIGPHRDDIKIILDGRDVRRFGSQGQRRLISVLLRLTELSYMEEKLAEPCVLLLDDLFSELDEQVSERLRGILRDGHQIFVTSPVMMDWGSDGRTKVFRVADGRITE